MNIVVTGSRTWTDLEAMIPALAGEFCLTDYEMHVGDARGADALARAWAIDNRVVGKMYRAKWRTGGTYNPRAGFERNTRMLIEAQPFLVIAFRMPGVSNGTDHTISEARRLGIDVRTVTP